MPRKTLIVVFLSIASMAAGIALFQLSDSRLNRPDIQSTQSSRVWSETSTSLGTIPLIDLDGVRRELGDWEQPVLIVNFWAPWCVPCRREVPELIALQSEYGDKIQILGLALDSAENIQAFADEYRMNYPSFLASEHIPMYNAVFNNKSGALPFTTIIDRNRKIGYSHTGIISLETLRDQISLLL